MCKIKTNMKKKKKYKEEQRVKEWKIQKNKTRTATTKTNIKKINKNHEKIGYCNVTWLLYS